MGVETALIATALLSTAHSIEQGNEAKRGAEQKARGMREQQEQAERESKLQQERDLLTQERDQKRASQQSAAMAAGGRSSTILTSPLGIPSGGKTLLGGV